MSRSARRLKRLDLAAALVAALVALVVAQAGCRSKASPPVTERIVAQAGDLAIVGATLLPMTSDRALTDHVLLVRGDKIVAVAPAPQVDVSAARIVDEHGKWVVPGLADMHVHFWSESDLDLFVLNGVTVVRDLFGSPQHKIWRDEIASGKRRGPTIISAGPIIDGNPPRWPGSAVVTTPEAARAEVESQRSAGYDLLKVYDGVPAEAYRAILEAAKRHGMHVAGHVPDAVGIEGVLASGQRTIEHLDGYFPFFAEGTFDPKLVALTAKAEIWNCPTLVVTERMAKLDNLDALAATPGLEFVPPVVRTQWNPTNDMRLKSWTPERYTTLRAKNQIRKQLLGELSRANAKLVLGTDTGNPYVIAGFAVHDELALMVEAGLTPYQALRSATIAAAEMMGTPAAFGSLQVGARADLLIVRSDPRVDLRTLADPSTIIVRGQAQSRAALRAAAAEAVKPRDPFADLAPIEREGEVLVEARYEVTLNDAPIGSERAIVSKLPTGERVVRGQAAYELPSKLVHHYRSTPGSLELWQKDRATDGIVTTRRANSVIAKPPTGAPLELSNVASDVIIAPQTIAPLVWHAERLGKLAPGATLVITTAELVVEGAPKLENGRYEYKRVADVAGRRAYSLTGTHGTIPMTGTLVVFGDGAPQLFELKIPWGTLAMRRTN